MAREVQTLQREVNRLKAQVKTERKTVVFRCFALDGTETATLDLDGNEYVGDPDQCLTFDVPDKAIRPILKESRQTVLHGGRA